MKVYSHHKRDFRIDGPRGYLDPTKGRYWQIFPNYRDGLTKLQGMVGTKDFLWCEIIPTHKRASESIDLVQWEIEIAHADVLAFLNEKQANWNSLCGDSPAVDWSKLIVKPTETQTVGNAELSCLVRYPVLTGATMREMVPDNPTRPKGSS